MNVFAQSHIEQTFPGSRSPGPPFEVVHIPVAIEGSDFHKGVQSSEDLLMPLLYREYIHNLTLQPALERFTHPRN